MTSLAKPLVRRGALWFGLLGGAFAWTVHLMTAYAIAEFGCVAQFGSHLYFNISLVAWLEIAITIVTALAAGVATLVAWRSHCKLVADSAPGDAGQAAERATARVGLLSSGLFTFVILFESLPILYYLRDC